MVLAGVALAIAVVLVLAIGPTPDNAALGVFVGLMVALLAWVVLLVAFGDRQEANFFTRAEYVLELSARGLLLRGHAGQVLGEQAAGSLRLYRTNAATGKLMVGALGIDHAGGHVRIVSRQPIGAWSGVPMASTPAVPFAVEPSWFDALLHCAP